MKRSMVLAALSTLLLAGCMTPRVGPQVVVKFGETTVTVSGIKGFDPKVVTPPNANKPNVFVVDDKMVVDQEPLRPHPDTIGGARYVLILWALDSTSQYVFPDSNAIQLQPGRDPLPPGLACMIIPDSDGKTFGCLYPHTHGKWKYTVRVRNNGGGNDPDPLDPWIHQE